jgi:iron(III) transport system permease protein
MTTLEAQTTRTTARRISWDRVIQWSIVILTALLVLFPSWPIIYQAFMDKPLYEVDKAFTLENFVNVLGDLELWRVVGTTAVYAVLTTLLAVVIGALLALLLTRTDMPGKGIFSSFVLVPFFISPLVLALGWGVIFGPQGYFTILIRTLGFPTWSLYTLGGIIVVTATYYAPYTYLYCIGSLALSDPQLEDAARIAGANPFLAMWKITVPLLRPAITYSALFTLVSAAEMVSIPLVLGLPSGIEVLSTYLYKIGVVGVKTDYGAIAVVSIMMVTLVAGLVALQGRSVSQERRFVTVGGKATRPRLIRLGRFRGLALVVVTVYGLIGILLPLAGIIAQSWTAFLSPLVNPLTVLTTENYEIVLNIPAYQASIINSVLISTFGAAIGIVFMGLIAIVAYRSEFRGRQVLSYLAMFPRAFPGIIVGIGFLWAFLLVPGLGGIRNTIWALTAAFIMRYLPLGYSNISPSLLRISNELDRAARVAGASWIGMVRHILLPMLFPALMSGYVLLFITFLKEYASALFLFARGSEVIGTTMIELWRQGNSGPVSALAAIQLLITVVVVLCSRRFLGVKLYE